MIMNNLVQKTCSVAVLCAAVGACLIMPNLEAADWPQWRGPQRNGISDETGLLKDWPKAGPKLLWQVENIGSGYSTPAVVQDRIYVLANRGLENEFVQALAAEDGQLIWSTRIGNVGNAKQRPNYPAARSTPTVDGSLLYALSSDGDLACLETATGKVRWKKSLRSDFDGKPGEWAYSESPLVDGNAVICAPGGSDATLIALDKTSGAVIWKCPLTEADEASYASGIVVEVGGIKQYVQFLQKGLVGVDSKTGKFLWRYTETAKNSQANIPTPVAHGGSIYSAAGRSGGALTKLKTSDGRIEVEEVYFSKKLPTNIGGSVRVGNYLYGTTRLGLLCADFATGKVKWQERGVGAGSVCYADESIYIHGENGDMALVEASPETYREKGRFTPPNAPDRGRSKAWAYPVVAGGRLYIRDMGTLWCYDIKQRP